MRFYINGELVAESKTKNYKYAFIGKTGACLKLSEERLSLEAEARWKIQDLEEKVHWYSEKARILEESGKDKLCLSEYKRRLAACVDEIDFYKNHCIVVLEAR